MNIENIKSAEGSGSEWNLLKGFKCSFALQESMNWPDAVSL